MSDERKNRPVWFAAIGLIVAGAIVLLVRAFIPVGALAPDFTLTDQDGKPFTLSAHRGHPIALFFGYAHCPDVCPTTLSALARAKRKLGDPSAFEVVLVTVDPKRDGPATLKRYVRLFDPAFIGLTGTEAQLDPVYAEYRVVHAIDGTGKSANGYAVTHSTAVQFIAPNGRLRGTGDWSDSVDDLAALMRQAQS